MSGILFLEEFALKSKRLRVALFTAAFALIVGSVWAQNRTALTIMCDKVGAQVYINNRLVGTTTPNFSQLVPAGTYAVVVKMRGYPDFSKTVVATGSPITLTVKFDAAPSSSQSPTTAAVPSPSPVQIPAPTLVKPRTLGAASTLGGATTTAPKPSVPAETPTVTPMTSGDAYSFQFLPISNSALFRVAVYGDGKYLISGNSGVLFSSPDGVDWKRQSSIPITNVLDIIYAGGQFVAVGDWGGIATSKDGISWTRRTSGVDKHLASIAYSGNRYVVSGQFGVLLYSNDGISWTSLKTGLSSHISSVAYGSGLFVAVTQDATVLTSSNGITWKQASLRLYPLQAQAVIYGDKGFVIGASGQNAVLLHSTDGNNWTRTYEAIGQAAFRSLFWDVDRYLAVNGSEIVESKDGKVWSSVVSGTTKPLFKLASGGGATIIVASDGSGLIVSRTPGKESPKILTPPTPPVATPTPRPLTPTVPAAKPVVPAKPAVADYVMVPAGTTSAANGNIKLDYAIEANKYEVTNAEFLAFLNDPASGVRVNGTMVVNKDNIGYFEMNRDECQIAYKGNAFYLKEGVDAKGNKIDLANYPVVFVTWYGAAAYCNWLSVKNGLSPVYDIRVGEYWENLLTNKDLSKAAGFRLPTDREWMYAARGGAAGQATDYAGSNVFGDVAWHYHNVMNVPGVSRLYGGGTDWHGTMPIGTKKANELGLYDMSGNACEWAINMSVRGGSFAADSSGIKVDSWFAASAAWNANQSGFRVFRTALGTRPGAAAATAPVAAPMAAKPAVADYVMVPAGTTSAANGNIKLDYAIEANKYEVTNAEFLAFLNDPDSGVRLNGDVIVNKGNITYFGMTGDSQIGYNGSSFYLKEGVDAKGNQIDLANYPVVFVTWYGAAAYCNWLSVKNGLSPVYDIRVGEYWENLLTNRDLSKAAGFRLPTDREWMYAARGGAAGQNTAHSGADTADTVAWYTSNTKNVAGVSRLYNPTPSAPSWSGTMPVGTKKANELGLYDMSGNACEWGIDTSVRGGSFAMDAAGVRVDSWFSANAAWNASQSGFRVFRTAIGTRPGAAAAVKPAVPAAKPVAAQLGSVVDIPLSATGKEISFTIGDYGTADEARYFKVAVPDAKGYRVAAYDPSMKGSFYMYVYKDAAMTRESGDGRRETGRLDHPTNGNMYFRDFAEPGTYYIKVVNRRKSGIIECSAAFWQYNRIYDGER